jgi:hypothetical protein
MKKDNKMRWPRPMGVTQMMVEYHKTADTALLDKAKSYLMQQWLISSGAICGRTYDIMQLSSFLKVPAEAIRSHMKTQLLDTKIWDRDKQEEIINSLIGQQMLWALDDRMEVQQQLNVLKEAQGGRYQAFISAEVTKAIGLKLQSSNNLGQVLSRLQGGGSINIFNNLGGNQEINQGVTKEEALVIIQKEVAEIEKPKELQYLEAKYDMQALPEVVATEQTGVDTTKEGTDLDRGEIRAMIDNYKGTMNEFEREHHELRREIEMQIDPEAPDPELMIYPD